MSLFSITGHSKDVLLICTLDCIIANPDLIQLVYDHETVFQVLNITKHVEHEDVCYLRTLHQSSAALDPLK